VDLIAQDRSPIELERVRGLDHFAYEIGKEDAFPF
jgi:hypothetical protein